MRAGSDPSLDHADPSIFLNDRRVFLQADKSVVKSPLFYVLDLGLFSFLLGRSLANNLSIRRDPLYGIDDPLVPRPREYGIACDASGATRGEKETRRERHQECHPQSCFGRSCCGSFYHQKWLA